MSFKSIGASAFIRILAACAALAGGAAISAPAFANVPSVDQVQVNQLSAQIVVAVRDAQLGPDCQAWNDFRNRRDLKSPLYRNREASCPVCSRDRMRETNPACRIDNDAAANNLQSLVNPQTACQSCEAAIASAIQIAIATSGVNPFVAQAALAQAQGQLLADGSSSAATIMAFAQVAQVVNQQASATTGAGVGGAPGGPGITNSISSPPSSSGGGGYVRH